MDVPQRARFERRPVAAPKPREKLALEPRHVDADRALRFARAAFQAQIEHIVHAAIVEPRLREPARHRQP